ncbi:MAG: FAD-dependent oxidoreductase [Lachnospiraceae bacterium]|nr:FAD-dependent oxidoreductase [Lachnospiraceae bacterium]
MDCDVVVCGAGAAGVVAAVTAAEEGQKVCLLQKESVVVSQGNCASAVLKSESTELGLKKWIHECTAFNAWRSKPDLLQAYIDNSEEALNWVCEKGGITEATDWTNEATGVSKYQDTSAVFTGVCTDGVNTYDYGEEVVTTFAPWFGPKPNNVGTLMEGILSDAQEQYGDMLDVRFSTPVVQLVQGDDGSVTGCVGQDEEGNYIKFNAKAVILATGAYENNPTMVRRFCPDIEAFDKKVYHRTGDGNILAIAAGGCMEPAAHSKVMHDFDAGLMYDEPFLALNMEGERFANEEVEMAYISNILRWQPSFQGENMDDDHADGSKGWYCQIYDNDYMNYATAGVPEVVMQRYLKEEDASLHEGVFEYLIDTFRADTIEELAEKLGLPVEATVASVERYNELCETGEDLDFGKKAEYMNKIQTAPFWGIRRHIRCSSICAGVLTDGNSRVITEDGEVINGLYAVGNLGGQFFGGADYPFFQTGLSLGHAFTFGRIAGKHASAL